MNKDGVKVSILTCSVVFFICFLGLYAMKNLQKWFITVLFLTVATTLNNVLGNLNYLFHCQQSQLLNHILDNV